MEIFETSLQDLWLIKSFQHKDKRGSFVKPFRSDEFKIKTGIDFQFKENFYSFSNRGVLRGMHFQIPPTAHQKLVYCFSGSVIDVVFDIRKNSETYGKFQSFELNAQNGLALFIPIGFAHGFLSLEDNSGMMYLTSHENHKEYDAGIHYNSFGMDWGAYFPKPIVSERDMEFVSFENFSPLFL